MDKKNYVAMILIGSPVVIGSFFVLYWKSEQTYFPGLPQDISHFGIYIVACLVFYLAAYLLSTRLMKSSFQGQAQGAEVVSSQIAALQQIVLDLKIERETLKKKIEEISLQRHLGEEVTISALRKLVPDQKQSIITRERVFTHEISNKLQIIHSVVGSVIEAYEAANENKNERLLRQLHMAQASIDKMIVLLAENREYLIIAA